MNHVYESKSNFSLKRTEQSALSFFLERSSFRSFCKEQKSNRSRLLFFQCTNERINLWAPFAKAQ